MLHRHSVLNVAGSESDLHLVKTDPLGTVIISQYYGGNDVELLGGIAMSPDSGCLVVGSTSSYGAGGSDIYLLKIRGTSLGLSEHPESPVDYSFTAWPSPFNSAATLAFELARVEDVTLRLYDLLGREVKTLADGRYSSGKHEFRLESEGMASGLYLARMETASGYTATRKVLLLR